MDEHLSEDLYTPSFHPDLDTIEWEDFEYEFKHKTSDWYWAVGIIAVSVAIAAIFFGNVLFGVLILLGAFTLSMHAARHPDIIHFELNPKGAVSGKTMYPYSSIDSFWVEDRDRNPRILLKSKKVLMPFIILPLGSTISDTARGYLAQHLKEEEHLEPLLQKIMEYLGF